MQPRHACFERPRAHHEALWEVVAGVAHVISPYWRAAGFVCVEREGLVHAAFQAWDSYKADDTLDCFSFGFYEVEAVREADGEWRMAALNINFAGQLEASADGRLLDGEGVNGRFCEQFARSWPPAPRE